MTETRWIKPLVARVRKPEGGQLAAGGENVAWETYWRRREADQDIALMTTAEIKEAEKAAEKAAKAQGDAQ